MKQTSRKRIFALLLTLGILAFVVVGLGYGILSYLNGTRLGVRSSAAALTNLARATLNRPPAGNPEEIDDIFFLHHSVGQNLIDQGDVRQRFTEAGYDFWDQGYNVDEGQRDPAGKRLNHVYYVPHDNTDPDGLEVVFSQPTFSLPLNTFSGLLQHDVIIVKSCFPNSQITSDEELEQYKAWYRSMRSAFDRHPDRLFIVVTQPPLNPAVTTPEAAVRARALANWLASEEFLAGHDNLAAFDLFTLLAEDDPDSPEFNMLRAGYREGSDSHPTQPANEAIGPLFVDAVLQAIEAYRSR
ncbi:MAG: hypothetical protein ACOYYS_13940 [Chloroflexota bacterium]